MAQLWHWLLVKLHIRKEWKAYVGCTYSAIVVSDNIVNIKKES
jgi:hypothetical protein